MRLTDRFDGSAAPFEGDRTLEIRSLPANAKVSKATVTLTPAVARGGVSFEETIVPGGNARVSWGATRLSGTGFVEVDFHRRRTLRAVQGNDAVGANLQVEMGGIYLQLNQAGAIKSASDPEFSVQNDRQLPGLTVSKFKLTRQASLGPPPGAVDLTSISVTSVPLNVTARLGNSPPFFTRVGEMSQEQVSVDFASVLQAFLAEAPVENGFYVVPLVLHSDLIARISVALAIEYVVESPVLQPGVGDPTLPFDYSGLAKTSQTLTIEVPADSRIASRGIQGRVAGAFGDTRILHPVPLPLVPVNESGRTVPISSGSTLAQPVKLAVPQVVTAIDLLLAVRRRGALQLDLHGDADGKPGSASLLPSPVRFEPAAQENVVASWLSVLLPAEFKFNQGERYWLVLQSLEGEAEWRVEPEPNALVSKPPPGMQRTQDNALSWRDAVPPEAGQPIGGIFRLRGRTTTFRMPIEIRVGPSALNGGRQPQPVSLDRFAPSGRVDFTLDFEELSKAANVYLDSASSASLATGEHLANGDFRQWLAVGNRPNEPVQIDSDTFIPVALSVASNGARAYLAVAGIDQDHNGGTTTRKGGQLTIVDLACKRPLAEEAVILGPSPPQTLVLSPDGSRAYVGAGDQLLLVDLTTGALLGDPFPIEGIFALAISPDGGALYATSFAKDRSAIQVIDTAALEDSPIGDQRDDKKTATGNLPLDFHSGAFVAVSPNGEQLYVAGVGQEEFRIFDTDSLRLNGGPVSIEGIVGPIAVTPDGKHALMPSATAIVIINLDRREVTSVHLGPTPVSVAVGSDSVSAYVAMANRTVRIIDLQRSTVKPEPIPLRSGADPVALALTAQGDRLVVANGRNAANVNDRSTLTLIELGMAWPQEWNVLTGEVSRLCFPDLPLPVLVLGSINRRDDDDAMPASAATAISQVVPVVESGRYEISFRALATTTDAFAEVIWRGQNCEAFPTERVPIQTLINRASAFTAGLRNERPLLAAHQKQLIAPEGARQAEIRFIAAEGAIAAITQASFVGTSEQVANADFSVLEENRLSAWTLSPVAPAGVTLLATTDGARVQNAGAGGVELAQTVAAKASQFFTLEFEGRVVRSSAEATSRVELRWVRDGTPVGEPTQLDISADGLAISSAQGRSPADVTQAEIRLAVPGGFALELRRISLRFVEAIPVTLSFMAEAPGELAITDLRVAFERIQPQPPPIPDDGLCHATPMPGGAGGEACDEPRDDESSSDQASYCPCCQSGDPLVNISHMQTDAGRPVVVGQCRSCGAEVPRFGGKLQPGAAPFALRPGPMTHPLVLSARSPARIRVGGEVRIAPIETLTSIGLIGLKRAERLMARGIYTPAKLAETSAEEIVKLLKPGVSLQQAEQIRTEAQSSTL